MLSNNPLKKPETLKPLNFFIPVGFLGVSGLMLVLMPGTAMNVLCVVFGMFLLLAGAQKIYTYFKSPIEERIQTYRLAVGMLYALFAVLLIFNRDALDELLPDVWSLGLFFGVFLKIQYAVDQYSAKVENWWAMLIYAGLSLVFSILVTCRYIFGDAANMWMGILLLVEAAIDTVLFFQLTHVIKSLFRDGPASPKPAAEAPKAEDGADKPEKKSFAWFGKKAEGKPAEEEVPVATPSSFEEIEAQVEAEAQQNAAKPEKAE